MQTRPISVSWIGSYSGYFNIASPGIQGKNLYVGVKKISTYNAFWNITASNNVFQYTSDTPAAGTLQTITLAPGIYNTDTINEAIQQGMLQVGESHANVDAFLIAIYTPNVGTSMTSPFAINVTASNSIRTVLGFNAGTYAIGFHVSQNAANITNNDYVYIQCNFITNGYIINVIGDSKINPGNTIYGFTVANNPGGLMQFTEANPLIMPCDNVLSMSFRLVNKYGEEAVNPQQTFTLDLIFEDRG